MSQQADRHDSREPNQEQLRLERVGGRAVTPSLIVAALALGLVVATLVIKPWEQQRPNQLDQATTDTLPSATSIASSTAQPTTAPATGPMPEGDPVALAAARRRQCQVPSAWRIVTRETTRLGDSRSVYAAQPAQAQGPRDPRMPVSQLHAERLRAVGVCVPRSPVVSPSNMLHQVVMWHVSESGEVREVQRPVVLDAALYDIGEAYFAPPADESAVWPPGRYMFEIRRLEGPGSRWIGLDFVLTSS